MHSLLVYRASAGSGKTFTLAARYVSLLLGGESFRSILAVTFTNKATAEMKQRIMEYLYEIGIGDIAENDAFLEKVKAFLGGSLPQDFRKKSLVILNQILNDYDHFAVSTIDSFLQILMAGLARKLHLRANYEVDMDVNAAIDAATDKLICQLDKESPVIQDTVRAFIKENFDKEKSWDIRRQIKQLCRELTKEPFLQNQDTIHRHVAEKSNIDNYRHALKHHSEYQSLAGTLKDKLEQYARLEERGYLKTYSKYFTGYIESIRAVLKDPNAKSSPLTKSKRAMVSDLDEWRKKCFSDAESSRTLLLEIDDLYNQLQNTIISIQLSEQYLHELCLISRIQEIINEQEQEKNSALISMTPITLKRELETGDATFILEKAGIRYRHIMIDEFQDTSHLQWELFKPLVEEVLANHGTVLLVGDVKQSIYRWRNGDWEILKDIDCPKQLGRFFKEGTGTIIPQRMNFRSSGQVVAFNLSLFKHLSEKMRIEGNDTIRTIYDERFTPESLTEFYNAPKNSGGYVQLRFWPYKKAFESQDSIIQDMFDQILELVECGTEQSKITILVRRKAETTAITNFLYRQHKADGSGIYDHLRIASAEAYLLESSVSVNILIQALRYLTTHNDIYLYYIISRYQHEVLGNPIRWEEIRQRVKGNTFAELLPSQFAEEEHLTDLPLYELMEKLARIFLYTPQGERTLQDDSFVYGFFDGLSTFISSKSSSPTDFLEYWEETLCKKAINGKAQGIQIMTIHKAKGLENDNIFVPFCDLEILSSRFYSNNIWCQPSKAPYDQMPWLPIQTKKDMGNSIYAEEYREEVFMQHVDCINLLYVACTRARRNLFLSCKLKIESDTANKESLPTNISYYILDYIKSKPEAHALLTEDALRQAAEANTFIEYHQGEIQENRTMVKPLSENKTANRLHLPVLTQELTLKNMEERFSFRQSADSYKFLYPEDTRYDTQAAHHGELLHLIYSSIKEVTDTENVIDTFQKQGLIASDTEKEEILQTINNSWKNPVAVKWFDSSWTLFRECNILEKDENGASCRHRPDRVLVKDGKAVVIDFKFGKESGQHKEQVSRYMGLMKKMGYKDIQGFLWYIGNTTNKIVEVTL